MTDTPRIMGLFEEAEVGGQVLESRVKLDDTLTELTQSADYPFTGVSTFKVPSFVKPRDFSLGVIVGSSGTGKSTLLNQFGTPKSFDWDTNLAVASQVDPKYLMRVGLSSIPSLCRPYHILSEGEKHRALIARSLSEGVKVIDEFSSVVHRDLAMSISIGTRKMIDKLDLKEIVIATCHDDVVKWLEPDWVYNTNTRELVEGRAVRQALQFEIVSCSPKTWTIFKDHHYLSASINKSARCWVALFNGVPVGFHSVLPYPSGSMKNAWREHRLCVLPDYQGMGLGVILSEYVAQLHKENGYRLFAKTAHPALGYHREKSPQWRATSKNKVSRSDYLKKADEGGDRKLSERHLRAHSNRVCFSHEYIG